MIETRSEHPPSIEERRLEADIRLKEVELGLRRDELTAQLEREKKGRWSPLATTIFVAVLGLLGTGLAGLMQGRASIEVEKQKLQSSLILSAIETGNTEEAAKNLRFLIKAGLIRDESGAMSTLLEQPEAIPVLPAALGKESSVNPPEILPSTVNIHAVDRVDFRCTNLSGLGRINVTLDGKRLVDQEIAGPLELILLPQLTTGSHMLSWNLLPVSQEFRYSCEVLANGLVVFRQAKDHLARTPIPRGFLVLQVH